MKIIDVSFYTNHEWHNLEEQAGAHWPALGYTKYISSSSEIEVIKHLKYEGSTTIQGIKFTGFKGKNHFFYLPYKALNYIRRANADVIIVQGLVFPVQVLLMKLFLNNKTLILVQHHGEMPFTSLKRWFQQTADKYITGYLFTSMANASPWIDSKMIAPSGKVFELLEASSSFRKTGKSIARANCNMEGVWNFLWVGRLNQGKDPMTVLKAFHHFSIVNEEARLYLIFQTSELLAELKNFIESHDLSTRVILIGKKEHADLENWYNAADFFLSGSHYEGSGYALLEAMACGCIPVVTSIPAFYSITAGGKFGKLFKAGNVADLTEKFSELGYINREQFSNDMIQHFHDRLSFRSIASKLELICQKLIGK